MSNGLPRIPLKTRTPKAAARVAAVQFINDERQGGNPARIPRARIEAAIRVATGQNQAQVNASLIDTYDDLVALGALPARRP